MDRGRLMGIQDVTLLPSQASFLPHFLKIVIEMKACGPLHVLQLWLGVSKGIFPVGYIHFNKVSFCVSGISWRSLVSQN